MRKGTLLHIFRLCIFKMLISLGTIAATNLKRGINILQSSRYESQDPPISGVGGAHAHIDPVRKSLFYSIVNPRRMRFRVTVVVLSVCYHASYYVPHLRVQFAVL